MTKSVSAKIAATSSHLTVAHSESSPNVAENDSHFVVRDGLKFAGQHLIIDLWDCERLDDLAHVQSSLIEAVTAIGATLLNVDLHHFEPNGGVSGVVVLAESHLSIHTWPEKGFAALDVFVCGGCDPYKAIPVLRTAFSPGSVQVSEIKRGLIVE